MKINYIVFGNRTSHLIRNVPPPSILFSLLSLRNTSSQTGPNSISQVLDLKLLHSGENLNHFISSREILKPLPAINDNTGTILGKQQRRQQLLKIQKKNPTDLCKSLWG